MIYRVRYKHINLITLHMRLQRQVNFIPSNILKSLLSGQLLTVGENTGSLGIR